MLKAGMGLAEGWGGLDPSCGASGAVLIVEDWAPLRRVYTMLLEGAGYRVYEAGSGAAALAALAGEAAACDVMILDVALPGLSGPETFAALRDLPRPPKVLFVSGHDGAAAAGLAPRADWLFLSKPFEPAALLAAVRRLSTLALSFRPATLR